MTDTVERLLDTVKAQASRIAELVGALRQIRAGSKLGKEMFEQRVRERKDRLTWYAVNVLQDNLDACFGTADKALSHSSDKPTPSYCSTCKDEALRAARKVIAVGGGTLATRQHALVLINKALSYSSNKPAPSYCSICETVGIAHRGFCDDDGSLSHNSEPPKDH